MAADDRSGQVDPAKGPLRGGSARTGNAAQKREEEAHNTRSGRPMPEQDSASRDTHHKSGYGGEHGEPRERSDETENGADEVE